MIGVLIFSLAILASLVWLWVGGIDYMRENHPDYKGEDFLDFNDEDKNSIS
jgi:hypothetical protein